MREHGLEDLGAGGQDGFVALKLSASTVKLDISELRVFKQGAKIVTEFTVGYFELKQQYHEYLALGTEPGQTYLNTVALTTDIDAVCHNRNLTEQGQFVFR